jgi:hypothetical protein
LIKSGIPGLEGLFSADGTGNFCAGFSKMSDEDKKRFLAAVTGSGLIFYYFHLKVDEGYQATKKMGTQIFCLV